MSVAKLFTDGCIQITYLTIDGSKNVLNTAYEYNKPDLPQKQGLPSANCLEDLLKKETDKSAQKHVQLRFLEATKEKMFEREKTVSQVAYELDFEYLQTSRFKEANGNDTE